MRAVIVIGWTAPSSPVPIYVGNDGIEASKAADAARESGKFIKIGRINNPSCVPIAHEPAPKPGPTVAEYVKAGHSPHNYPPKGYSATSPETEIFSARKAFDEAGKNADELAKAHAALEAAKAKVAKSTPPPPPAKQTTPTES